MSNRINENESALAGELDLLADIVAASHEGTYYQRGWYRGSWGLQFDSVSAGFHIVTSGEVLLRLQGGAARSLREGDVALLSEPHIVASDPRAVPQPFSADALAAIRAEEGAGEVCMLCGAYQLGDAGSHPVFSKLPPLILMRAGQRNPAVDAMVALLDAELKSRAPGAKTVAGRIIDALLVLFLRHWIETDCPSALHWMRALRNPTLSRVLTLIHNEYGRNWTLDTLARAVGTSRATLARSFSSEVGISPIRFLTERRLGVAKHLLENGARSLEEVAGRVGYSSAFALSKAFKREYGLAPTHCAARGG